MSLTVEQLEAARAERMRQNGHGAITLEDVRTWIEETGLCLFLPRSAQAGFTAPTFVEAVAGQRTTEPTLELVHTAETLLTRLEADGVAVRLNLAGQPGDQPDYVVAGWVLPYVYALRGDRDWRRAPQLTGSRQVSQLAVQTAKQLESANQNVIQIRDALGREVTEAAVLRALHELWKQLRIIPVVPEPGKAALWQPLRQRFQKAIAEGASTSQVTAISVLASIYLQAVIAASMEDVELFLSPLTSRSKIREVVRGLAATRQVHSTTMGHQPMFYVAGTLPEFPAVPSYQISSSYPAYRSYREEEEFQHSVDAVVEEVIESAFTSVVDEKPELAQPKVEAPVAHAAPVHRPAVPRPAARPVSRPSLGGQQASKTAPRPRTAASAHPRERVRPASESRESRPATSDRRRPVAPRSNGQAGHSKSQTNGHSSGQRNGFASKNGTGNGSGNSHSSSSSHGKSNNGFAKRSGSFSGNGSRFAKPANGNGKSHAASNGTSQSRPARNGHGTASPNGARAGASNHPKTREGAATARPAARPTSRPATGFKASSSPKAAGARSGGSSAHARPAASNGRKPAAASHRPKAAAPAAGAKASASKRYSFSGQAKQAPKPAGKATARPSVASKSRSASSARPAAAKRRG